MIRLTELNHYDLKLTIPVWNNLLYHLHIMNEIRYLYKKPMYCSSGVRNWEEHQRIYDELNLERAKKGLKLLLPPSFSTHLSGQGSDWVDPKGDLYFFLKNKPKIVEKLGVFVEDRKYTPNHTHLQTRTVTSGSHFFRP